MPEFHPLPPPLPEDITDGPERDQAFTPTNDAIWGEGGWMKCYQCPRDRKGNPVYHHRGAHFDGPTEWPGGGLGIADGEQSDGSSDEDS